MSLSQGQIDLVGAGPGDPGLVTVRGLQLLQQADVVVYDRLANPMLLSHARREAELIDVGKTRGRSPFTQDGINALLIDRARGGARVVRLKGGDPMVFGRGGEELQACRAAGLNCRVIPGVSSAIAGPTAVGIPVTHRGVARSLAVVTAETLGGPDAAALRRAVEADTLVILMGRAGLRDNLQQLIDAGRDPHTPSACVERATLPQQCSVQAPLSELADAVERADLQAPMVTIVGAVAAFFDADSTQETAALAGRNIAVTRPRARCRGLKKRLEQSGAHVVSCPLIEIAYDDVVPDLDSALRHGTCDWLVLGSVHAAAAVIRRLQALELDARALNGCRIAVVGSATAQYLRRRGLRASLVPAEYTAAGLLAALRGHVAAGDRVLYPHSDLSPPDLGDGLRALGAEVVDIVAYSTRTAFPAAGVLTALRSGVDAILFHSPSAVRSFVHTGIPEGDAVIACIGPRTTQAAREAGLDVSVSAEIHSDPHLVTALAAFFAQGAGGTVQR